MINVTYLYKSFKIFNETILFFNTLFYMYIPNNCEITICITGILKMRFTTQCCVRNYLSFYFLDFYVPQLIIQIPMGPERWYVLCLLGILYRL